ncbi:hypothetical protein PoB_003255400 [Plakobranchus ocellatus]|uniref:Uncharacterized protein n=1 Tax=Plakobranchus ocellatus TaxID=259542 RepID=A0AAV4AEH1_9GAST|nr:hypothetical protein PoB_003255400 [Plakobranchus ocellatus]
MGTGMESVNLLTIKDFFFKQIWAGWLKFLDEQRTRSVIWDLSSCIVWSEIALAWMEISEGEKMLGEIEKKEVGMVGDEWGSGSVSATRSNVSAYSRVLCTELGVEDGREPVKDGKTEE